MLRAPPRTTTLNISIAASVLVVFVLDVLTPLGVSVWVFYALPCVLALFVWNPRIPAATAAVCSALVAAGLFLSPQGASLSLATANRGFGLLTFIALGIAGQKFVRQKRKVRDEEWLREGQTGISAKLQGEISVAELGEQVLSFLTGYLGARAGVFYEADAFGTAEPRATWGTPRKVADTPVVTRGQGLVGRTLAERTVLVVDDAPGTYLETSSGLGRARSTTLVLAPAISGGELHAVLELGFFRELGDIERALLDRILEPIAIATRSAAYRKRLRDLLEETQRQGEELEAQQEELRVANEELHEQSNALRVSQKQLEVQQSELESVNQHLEQQAELLAERNDHLARAQRAILEKAAEAERASRYKSEFLANMSHELRTPLNSSLILAKLLADNREGNLTPEQVRFAETIQGAGNDLLVLINDILDLSKIEAGRVELDLTDVPVQRIREQLERTFEPVARQKGIEFRLEIDARAPAHLRTDAQRLDQILKNLLSNAFKFTERGRVTFRLAPAPGDRVTLSVTDTGIGIREEQRDTIFEAFRQADGTTNRKYGGTGLGLSISRELARLLGGDVRVESELGKGSTFVVDLPVSRASDHADTPAPDASFVPARRPQTTPPSPQNRSRSETPPSGGVTPSRPSRASSRITVSDDRDHLATANKRLLVIEDDERFAGILVDLGRELGFACIATGTADEGTALAKEHLPSAILLDVNLPDHTGLTVLDRLKRDPRTRHIPVHVVSGIDRAQQALDMGAVGYLAKPVKREDLVAALSHVETKLSTKVRRVLVVEDDDTARESIRGLLTQPGVEVVPADTVAKALSLLKESSFDCVVTDLKLPDRSGFDLLETMAADDAHSFPPVIVYTGRDLTPEEELRLRKQSSSIIVKGARSPERLLDEVTLFLHQVESDLPPERRRMLEQARDREGVFEGRTILVVEDDVRNVFALSSVLEGKGAKVVIARNGREALSKMEAHPEIALVLMDIMMPEMDGLEATREIRKRPEWAKVPIIALTAKAMRDDQERCLEAGANDFVAKPLDVEMLLSLLRVWMPR
jgi:CheY-like chemotaxis protein